MCEGCSAVHLSLQENLSNNTESGLSFKSRTCEVGVFSICTLLHGFGRGSESAVKEEVTLQMKAPEIQVLEAEQNPMMSLSCQNLVTGNSDTLGVLESRWLVCCSGRRVGGGCVSQQCPSLTLQSRSPDCCWSKFYSSIC